MNYSEQDETASEIRYERVMKLVRSSRAALQLAALKPEELIATADQFYTLLSEVPDSYIEPCLADALKKHKTRSPVLVGELLDSWKAIQPAEYHSEAIAKRDEWERRQEAANCPHYCTGDNLIVRNDMAERCPIHRPEKWHTGTVGEDEYLAQKRKEREHERRLQEAYR